MRGRGHDGDTEKGKLTQSGASKGLAVEEFLEKMRRLRLGVHREGKERKGCARQRREFEQRDECGIGECAEN